jgi:hypothetical protein
MAADAGPAWWEGAGGAMPPEPDFEPLHQRDYLVRAWKVNNDTMLVRGAVMDLKPAAMFATRIEAAGGRADDRPVTMHHMIVDLTVAFPSMTIGAVDVRFEVHPQPGCPLIGDSYDGLVGVSIARGFTHKVRELFGGPRGCTHTTALLQAMAPVAVQSVFGMRRLGATRPGNQGRSPSPEAYFVRNTCHVWSEEGDLWQGILVGHPPPAPLSLQQRLRDAGLDPGEVDLQP